MLFWCPSHSSLHPRRVVALAQDKSDEKQRKLPHTLLVWLFASPLSKTSCLSAMLS